MPLHAIDLQPPTGQAKSRLGRWGRVLYVTACLVALVLSAYLTTLKLTGRISDLAGCGGAGGCADILGGRWANWLRVPISVWAIVVYAPMLLLGVMGLTTARRRRLAFIGSSLLVAAACWFLFVQAVIERRFCPYCCVLHGCGAIAFAWTLAEVWSRDVSERAIAFLSAGAAASLTMVALIAGQFFGPQPATHEITVEDELGPNTPLAAIEPASHAPMTADVDRPSAAAPSPDEQPSEPTATADDTRDATTPADTKTDSHSDVPVDRVVKYFDGLITMPLAKVPLIGSPDARHVMLKYFDYTCSSCRQMHDDLAAAMAAYPDDLALIVIPCPMNRACNSFAEAPKPGATGPEAHQYACELARIGLAVWRTDRTKFEKFHDEMFAQQGRMTARAASLVAESLIGSEPLAAAMSDPWIDSILKHSVGVYGRMKARNPRMPKLLLGGRKVLHGVAADYPTFLNLLREQLQLDAPGELN